MLPSYTLLCRGYGPLALCKLNWRMILFEHGFHCPHPGFLCDNIKLFLTMWSIGTVRVLAQSLHLERERAIHSYLVKTPEGATATVTLNLNCPRQAAKPTWLEWFTSHIADCAAKAPIQLTHEGATCNSLPIIVS